MASDLQKRVERLSSIWNSRAKGAFEARVRAAAERTGTELLLRLTNKHEAKMSNAFDLGGLGTWSGVRLACDLLQSSSGTL